MEEYSDWLLNKSIASHFNAFKEGFDLVMGQNFLADLFRPEELEMMVCGSNVSMGVRRCIYVCRCLCEEVLYLCEDVLV